MKTVCPFLPRALCLLFLAGTCALYAESDSKPGSLNRELEEAAAAEKRGDYPSARKLYEQAAQKNPASAEAWAALGEHLRFYAHDVSASEAAFKKALGVAKPDPRASAFAWRGLGELAAKDGRDDVALEHFKKSAAALPLADTYRSLCHLYCKLRKFKEASEAAGEAVKLDPGDGIARLLYAAQLHRAGQTDRARAEYQKAVSENGIGADGSVTRPVHCCILYNAAGYLAVCGENENALKMLREFLETPNHRHLTRQEIETDADFETLKTLPKFRVLLEAHYRGNEGLNPPSETKK